MIKKTILTGTLFLFLIINCKVVKELKYFIDDSYDFSGLKTITVLKFSDYKEEKNSGEAVTDMIGIILAENNFNVIDRKKFEELTSRYNLDPGSEIDVVMLQKLNELSDIKIDAIMTGSVSDYSRNIIKDVPHTTVGITIRLFTLDTGSLIGGASLSLEKEDFDIHKILETVCRKIMSSLLKKLKQ